MTMTPPSPVARLGRRIEMVRRSQDWRPRADSGSLRGTLWAILLAADFFLISNPLVFIPSFDASVHKALVLTAVFVLVNLFWLRLPGVPWELLLFLGFAALSSTWSLSGPTTWHTVELYVFVAAVALLIAANVTVSVLVDGLALGGVLIVVASLYAVQANLPGAVHPPESDGGSYMAGVGTHKNILAYTLVLCLAAVVSVVPRTLLGWMSRLTCLGAILLGIFLSHSGTGFLATAAVLGVTAFLLAFERFGSGMPRRRLLTLQGALIVAAVLTATAARQQLVAMVGKDDSLTGRVPVWHAVITVMRDGPLLIGHGWGAVWSHPWQIAPPNAVVDQIYARAGFVMTHGHNSWFDLLPQLGLVGVSLAAVLYLRPALRGVSLRHRPELARPAADLSRFLLVGLVGHLALGMTEPLLTIPVGFFVLVLMVQSRCSAVGATSHPQHGFEQTKDERQEVMSGRA